MLVTYLIHVVERLYKSGVRATRVKVESIQLREILNKQRLYAGYIALRD